MGEPKLPDEARQCLARRIADESMVAREVVVWEARRNCRQVVNDWRLTGTNARTILKRLSPQESLSQTARCVVSGCDGMG